ncbi:MAG TPA: DUF6498-containing protein [Candidatus Limnocylindrales bacterium]|jgi:hypothetical protein
MADPAAVGWLFDATKRAQRLSHSSAAAVGALVVGNLIPLVGVLMLGWQVGVVLGLYWLENGIVGAINCVKMAMAQGDGPAGRNLKLTQIPFFVIHYGLFWFVHGVFVGVIATIGTDAAIGGGFGLAAVETDPLAILVAVVGLATGHLVSFWVNFVGKGEYRTVTVTRQMAAPYGRMVVLHMAIVFGGFLIALLGSPEGPIIVLVLGKTVLDLNYHLRDREKAAAAHTTPI